MDKELTKDGKENEEIDALIEKLSSSAIEFRNATGNIIFNRLRRLFQSKEKQITSDTRLQEIFPENCTEGDWVELEKIGLKIPGLKRAKAYSHISVIYLIVALGSLFVFSILNLDLVFVVWGLPIFGFILTLTCCPILLFMLIFKRRHFPCETVDSLIDQIIAANWTDLITEDKKLFKDIVRQENEFGERTSAQQ